MADKENCDELHQTSNNTARYIKKTNCEQSINFLNVQVHSTVAYLKKNLCCIIILNGSIGQFSCYTNSSIKTK